MYSVLIVDNCPLLRLGVKYVLKEAIGNLFFVEVDTAGPVLTQLRKRSWDVVVLGASTAAKELDVLKEIKHTLPSARVLLLAGRSHPDAAHRALHAGASGFVTKNCALADLIRAFRRVLAGGNYIGEQPRTPSSDPIAHSKLSKREYAVLLAIAAGKRTTDIASELNLDVRTISTYRRRVLGKMKIQTNAELIRYAAEHGL